MATFKNIQQSYTARKMMEYWGNLVQNLDEDCQDDDLFDPLAVNISRDRVESLLRAAFDEDELDQMSHARVRCQRLDLSDRTEEMLQAIWNTPGMRKRCKLVLAAAKGIVLANLSKCKGKEPIERRIDELQRVLKLSDLERDIMIFAWLRSCTCIEYPRHIDTNERPLYFAMALNRSYNEVLAAMGPKGRLRRYEVLDCDWDFGRRNGYGAFLDGTEKEALERRFYKKSDVSDVLPWEFYGDLAEKHGSVIKQMLAANKGKGRMNILLYGAPGTGKTSFAKTLAAEMGLAAYEIRQGDEDGKNMTAQARMAGIQLCNDQTDSSDSIMIVDEADELLRDSDGIFSMFGFGFGGGKSTEKGVINTILDEMKVPAIWISNAPAGRMDESVRRRFDYSVCFEKLNSAQREAIWRNGVKKFHLEKLIDDGRIPDFAAKYIASAGGISMVLENVKKLAPTKDRLDGTIAVLMKQHCELMGTDNRGKFILAKDYSLKGLNIKGKVKPEKILTCVENFYKDSAGPDGGMDRPRMNILMYGPPGTGKTEFVKFLGEKTGRRVIVKKGSDILGMYVGQSEQNIRAAFREAEAEHAILFFDEIDGLLQDRSGASHSWEVTQVNELLQQMEEFNGVMVAATNFHSNLDHAVLRRFTFKLQFDFLDEDGKVRFFEHFFNTKLNDAEAAELHAIRNLAPGDFRTVRQAQYYLGGEVTNADRLAALREESEAKPKDLSSTAIGF